MKIKNDLVFIKWAYDMYDDFIDDIKKLIEYNWLTWDLSNIIYVFSGVIWSYHPIENYLFLKYWEQFVLECFNIWNDPSKKK